MLVQKKTKLGTSALTQDVLKSAVAARSLDVVYAAMFLSAIVPLTFMSCTRNAPKVASDGIDLTSASQFRSVSAAGSDSLWVVTLSGDLMRISRRAEPDHVISSADGANVVAFVNSTQGWVIDRKSRVLMTSDGGKSWQVVSVNENEFDEPHQLVFRD